MNITKYVSLFIWALLLLGAVFFIIKQIAFSKKKSKEDINTSEAIYLAALIISAGLIFQKAIQDISQTFDSLSKIQPNEIWFQFIKTSSAISVCGIILFIVALYIARFLSTLFFSNRNAIIEFDANNIPYAIVRGALMTVVSLIFLQIIEGIFNYLVPSITIPLYR